jgi:hypothetical protein
VGRILELIASLHQNIRNDLMSDVPIGRVFGTQLYVLCTHRLCRKEILISETAFIARECMSREELEEKIDSGIQPDAMTLIKLITEVSLLFIW